MITASPAANAITSKILSSFTVHAYMFSGKRLVKCYLFIFACRLFRVKHIVPNARVNAVGDYDII